MSVRSCSPVIMMMTVDAFMREPRIWRASSRPSGGGMRMSRNTAWNFSLVRRSAASRLLVSGLASKPADRKISAMSSHEGASSSTTRIWARKLSFLPHRVNSGGRRAINGSKNSGLRGLEPALQFFAQHAEVDRLGNAGIATRLQKAALLCN